LIFSKRRKIAAVLVIAVGLAGLSSGFLMVRASHKPSFCSACHIMEPYYQSWSNSTLLANKHEQENVTCQDCHQSSYLDKAKEGVKFITGQYENPLPRLKVSNQFCLDCHESYQAVAAKTANLTPNPHENPHDPNLDCTACHKMHTQSEVYCSMCHSFDWSL
jgi:cytochrome c nitrite reductase small subunit